MPGAHPTRNRNPCRVAEAPKVLIRSASEHLQFVLQAAIAENGQRFNRNPEIVRTTDK